MRGWQFRARETFYGVKNTNSAREFATSDQSLNPLNTSCLVTTFWANAARLQNGCWEQTHLRELTLQQTKDKSLLFPFFFFFFFFFCWIEEKLGVCGGRAYERGCATSCLPTNQPLPPLARVGHVCYSTLFLVRAKRPISLSLVGIGGWWCMGIGRGLKLGGCEVG